MTPAPPAFTAQDKALLRLLQEDIPLCADPWGEIGAKVGLSGAEVLARLELWQKQGLIRKIGPSVSPRALGWFSTLCAVNVPPNLLEPLQAYIAGIEAITHCYVRDNPRYNVWFTIIAPTEAEALALAADIGARFDLAPAKSFPATQVFKIKATFDLQ